MGIVRSRRTTLERRERQAIGATTPSRYCEGKGHFEVLYLAYDHLTALFEVQAMLGTPYGTHAPSPHSPWTILNTNVTLQHVADITRVSQQHVLDTTAQELTGDWRGYQLRNKGTPVRQPAGSPAPTQELGEALFVTPHLEGFRTLSARVPTKMILVVFPEKLVPGSHIVFEYQDNGQTVRHELGSA